MKCFKHYDRDAVSQCVDCSKGLCPECTARYNIPLCDSCTLRRISASKAILLKNIGIMIIAFFIGYCWQKNLGIGTGIVYGIYFSGLPWGWNFLSKITPNVFLFMPLIGWAFYFIIKFSLALVIGIYIMPFKLYQIIKGLIDAEKLKNYAKSPSI